MPAGSGSGLRLGRIHSSETKLNTVYLKEKIMYVLLCKSRGIYGGHILTVYTFVTSCFYIILHHTYTYERHMKYERVAKHTHA